MHHDVLDQRALAMDRLVAAKVRANPALVDRAREIPERWLVSASPRARPALLEWLGLLDGGLDSISSVLEGGDERCTRLRQSSPFWGILTREERTRILLEFHRREPLSA